MTTASKIKHAIIAGLCAAVAVTCALAGAWTAFVGFACAAALLLREAIR